LETALSVQEAEKHEKFSESFNTGFDNSLRVRSPSPTRRADHRSYTEADARHAAAQARSQRNQTSRSNCKPKTSGSRNAQTKAALIYYKCEGIGHFARECPTRLNREVNSTNSPGKRNPSEVRNVHALREKSPHPEQEGSAKRKSRVRETRARCKGRQLLSPQRP